MRKIIWLILLAFTACLDISAQNNVATRCTEQQIPFGSRKKYIAQAEDYLRSYYRQLLLNVDDLMIQEQFIANNMEKGSIRYKPEFLFQPSETSQYLAPEQYLQELDKQFKGVDVDDCDFEIQNITIRQEDFFLPNLVSCYVMAEYDLSLKVNGNAIFIRRCRAYCLFPNVMAYIEVKLFQLEPLYELPAGDGVLVQDGRVTEDVVRLTESVVRTVDSPQPPTESGMTVGPSEEMHNSYEYVDLGLSVKWATCNVGARTPEDFGHYFAWGETIPDKRKFTKKTSETYRKNNIYEISSDPGYDAAAHIMGGLWRMPTRTEMHELVTRCKWVWSYPGYRITGPNGNCIFLPAGGDMDGNKLYRGGTHGYYWTSTPGTDNNTAYYLYFYENGLDIMMHLRYYGRLIRPVISK